ncbi:hypothetical protein MAM1_0172d07214 [Mucor ambiguus]|uniref:Uncharacterized protein n=1 Tax=Mucor ambiguus TaxID=91626 RepID=A0A0C9MW34_9FUNG|nr:hypothetical protein MAM1_0172d07214 [Mucor ambiguus]
MKLSGMLLILVQMVALMQHTGAYCIYNKTNKRFLDLHQTSYHTKAPLLSLFQKHVAPESRECCPYTTPDCAMSGTKDEVVVVTIQAAKYFCYSISLPAGGWVNVIDPRNSLGTDILDFQVFDSDGKPFDYERLAS